MKKYLLILLVCFSCATSNTDLSSGNETVAVSNVNKVKEKVDFFGETYNTIKHTGNYTINRNGRRLEKGTFSSLQLNKEEVNLNIRHSEGYGNTLTYDIKSRKYNWGGKSYKVKNTSNMQNIILEGILFYSKSLEE